jgi:hypothetical protein
MDIKILFGIDMETDVGSFTPFYEGIKKATPWMLDLFDKKGVKGTFYFTGHSARNNPDAVRLVAASGSEVGCHSLFHETVGDELFSIPGIMPLLEEEVPLRLRRATEWVEEVAGFRPRSFRCPRLWGSTAVVNALEGLGYTSDASYPMYYYRKQFAPYHPSRENWTEQGDLRILEIPNFADMVMESNDPGLERDRDQWPLFRTESADALMEKINRHIGFLGQKGLPVVLCFYFHPWEFIPCKTQYMFGEGGSVVQEFIVKGCGEKAKTEFTSLIDMLKDMGAQFVTAADIADEYAGK